MLIRYIRRWFLYLGMIFSSREWYVYYMGAKYHKFNPFLRKLFINPKAGDIIKHGRISEKQVSDSLNKLK